MSGCARTEEGALLGEHAGAVEAAVHRDVDALPESFVSTAQWVARHADIKQRFEKIRSEFEQRCSSCSGAEPGPKTGGPPPGAGGYRRPSESATRHHQVCTGGAAALCSCSGDALSEAAATSPPPPLLSGYATLPNRSSSSRASAAAAAAREDYLDWMYTQKPPGSSGRSRAVVIPLRSTADRRSEEDSCGESAAVRQSLGSAGHGKELTSPPPPLPTCQPVPQSDPPPDGVDLSPSPTVMVSAATKERKGSCIFTFDGPPGGVSPERQSKLPRSASFTMDCHAAAAAAAAAGASDPGGLAAIVHRSPSQPMAKGLDATSGGWVDPLRILPGVQVSRVKKVGSLRSFGLTHEDRTVRCQSAGASSSCSRVADGGSRNGGGDGGGTDGLCMDSGCDSPGRCRFVVDAEFRPDEESTAAAAAAADRLPYLTLVRSPRVQRRPAVPPLLQSPSPQQQQHRSLASPDCCPSAMAASAAALSPIKLRPAVLHPELKHILSQLNASPESAADDSSSAAAAAAAASRGGVPAAAADDDELQGSCSSDDTAVDEGLDMSASFGESASAKAHYLHQASVDFAPAAIDDGCSHSKKKAGKRSHTHPPSTKVTAENVAYTTGEAKAKDTNGFSHMTDHRPMAAAADGVGDQQGLSADISGSQLPPDSLYNSLDDVVDASGLLVGQSPIPSAEAATSCHQVATSLSAAAPVLALQSVCTASAASAKFKRVKSDPFPDLRSLTGSGDSSSDTVNAIAAASAAASSLGRSPSDATHERSRCASAGQHISTVGDGVGREGTGVGGGVTPMLTDAISSGELVSSDGSTASVATTGSGQQGQRIHIVNEIIEKEEIYVANLEQVSQAVSQLKEQEILDSSTVDKIFCSIRLPESRVHHKIFLESMRLVQRHWDPNATTVGDRIANMFSSQSVLENYMAYVNNCSKSKARLEQAFKTKPNFCKFNEAFRRSNVSRQDLRAVLSLPANHLISYRFFIERMLKYTPVVHPDSDKLMHASGVVLDLLDKVGGQDSTDGAEAERTLKKLEALLSIQDLALQPDRIYLRNDCVSVKPGKRECYYVWLFSDIVLITIVKGSKMNTMSGKLGHPRRSSMTVLSPRGQEVIEKVPHKLCMRLGLEEVDVVMSPETERRKCAKDVADAENDLERLMRISDEADALVMQHERLQKNVLELMETCNQRLAVLRHRRDTIDMLSVQLLITSGGAGGGPGVDNSMELTLTFESAEKRSSWEAMLSEAKVNLEASISDKLPPEFKEAIPITKTRSGMQFSCAAAIEGVAMRDVWICNSDNYVGHVCLLNLLPQPTVSMSAAVPSCTSRVLCICAVPAAPASRIATAFTCSLGQRNRLSHSQTSSSSSGSISRSVATVAAAMPSVGMSGGSSTETLLDQLSPEAIDERSESDGSDNGHQSPEEHDDDEDEVPTDDDGNSAVEDLCIHETTDLTKSLMWLGTEDGYIHIFNSEENLRTSRIRPIRIQHKASVLCVVFLEQSVFVSLNNGCVVVYRRSEGGGWDLDGTSEALSSPGGGSSGVPPNLSITLPAPVTKMLAVCGKLWCSYQNEIVVLDPSSLKAEISFAASSDRLRTVQSMVYSRHGIVAVAIQGSCEVRLFHATNRKHLGDISIAAAVAQKLQGCDDIIRQHKAACLKITALLSCKDSLWVGTSAGVILTMPLPKITSSMANSREYSISSPPITGLPVGHTGNVRFLLCADVPRLPVVDVASQKSRYGSSGRETPAKTSESVADAATATTSATATPSVTSKVLVISGGDGFEVFGGSALGSDSVSGVGSSDSVNHLLLWEV